jgi:hypothetical protein
MSDQGGDTRIELMFRLEAALKRIETLEVDIAASEHNFRTMRQLRNEAAARIEALEAALVSQQEGSGKLLTDMVTAANKDSKIAADRIEALEAALRMIDRGCALGPDFVIDKTEHSMLIKIQRIALAALAPKPDK